MFACVCLLPLRAWSLGLCLLLPRARQGGHCCVLLDGTVPCTCHVRDLTSSPITEQARVCFVLAVHLCPHLQCQVASVSPATQIAMQTCFTCAGPPPLQPLPAPLCASLCSVTAAGICWKTNYVAVCCRCQLCGDKAAPQVTGLCRGVQGVGGWV